MPCRQHARASKLPHPDAGCSFQAAAEAEAEEEIRGMAYRCALEEDKGQKVLARGFGWEDGPNHIPIE